ncbi:MAG: precorrin-3B C(17)-methyltransferase [Dehalococcoidia bacterium]|nr:precorrin-3B C(17)-methyltransferase [Dehalococcoidia bacterium]
MPQTEPTDLAIVAITVTGAQLGARLRHRLDHGDLYVASKALSRVEASGGRPFDGPVGGLLQDLFPKYRKMVLFIALGAVVRLLAPLLKDKKTDPGVVVVDDSGKYAVSVLSGHVGGANELARLVASHLGGEAVITTGSDVLGTPAPDMLGREMGWVIEDQENLTKAGAAIVNGEPVGLFQDAGERNWWDQPLPANIKLFDSLESLAASSCAAALIVTDRLIGEQHASLLDRSVIYRPKSLALGIGCNRGASSSEVQEAVLKVLEGNALSVKSVRNVATIDIKSNEEGILEFARAYGLPITYYSGEELDKIVDIPNPSEAIRRLVGSRGVCEPAAMLSAGTEQLLIPKTKAGNVTVAVARVDPVRSGIHPEGAGTIFVVGLGPGAKAQMTYRAREALAASDVVVGYKTYLRLIEDLVQGKEVISSGMRQEVARARQAIELAEAGRKVAVVSSGDAGVYGMAGLVYEVARARGWPSTQNIEVIPGVSALNAASALLGAPLMHDFAVISLSDLLTPWDTIIHRLRAAGESDFVLALYNPKSGRRTRQIEEARGVLLEYRSGATPVGLVTSAYRQRQEVAITDLDHMLEFEIGMLTIVIVGSSRTTTFGGAMVTPRGYQDKYDLGSEEYEE